MGWVDWAIPLIAVAVWILSSLAKNYQDQTRAKPVRPAPRPIDPDRVDRGRRSPAERVDPRGDPFDATRTRRPVVRRAPPVPIPQRPRTPRQPPPVPRVEPAPVAATEVVMQPELTVERPAPKVSMRPLSAFALSIHNAMTDRQTLATAILLKEVLGPPRCRVLQRNFPGQPMW